MHIKFFTWFFVFILCAAACAPQASLPQATEGIPTATSTSTPITVPVAVPKHQDLIFVEFFAGT